jgi:predicted RNase H-like nuclease (RuvC/YqgF family)
MTIYAGIDTNPLEAHTTYSTFAVTILDENGTKKIFKSVQSSYLAKLVRANKIDVLAFDNLAEIAPILNRLVFELSKIERTVDFVEVAYDEPLETKAARFGLFRGNKLGPQQASEIVVKLAQMGQGKKLDFFSPKTIIRVVRRRVPGSGGSSTLRFKRNIEAQIKYLANRIKEKLENAKLDFDIYVRESTGGYSSAVFVVYSPSEDLHRIVYPSSSRDYAVRIEKVQARYRHKEPLSPQRPILVGYDPGVTTGVAILDLDGSVLSILSARNLDRTDVAEHCAKFGKPVIVSTDVSAPPEAVKKLSSAFGAKLFCPLESMTIEEKRELVRRFDTQHKVKTSHERDSLAAAAKAFIFYSQLFENTKQKTVAEGLSSHLPEVIGAVLGGKNIVAALNEIRMRYAVDEVPKFSLPQPSTRASDALKELEAEMSLLRARLVDAESRAVKLMEHNAELEVKLNNLLNEKDQSLRKEREVANLELRLAEALKKLEEAEVRLKASNALMDKTLSLVVDATYGKLCFVKILDDITKGRVLNAFTTAGNRRGELVFVRNPSSWDTEGLMLLKKNNVVGIVVSESQPNVPLALEEQELPVLSSKVAQFSELRAGHVGTVHADTLRLAFEKRRELEERNKMRKIEELRKLLIQDTSTHESSEA